MKRRHTESDGPNSAKDKEKNNQQPNSDSKEVIYTKIEKKLSRFSHYPVMIAIDGLYFKNIPYHTIFLYLKNLKEAV